MTKKDLDNMKLIFKDLMKYAKKKKINLIQSIWWYEIKVVGCTPPNNPKDESRVYLPEEKEKLFCQLNKRLMQMPYKTDSYVVFLLFKLGLRIVRQLLLNGWILTGKHVKSTSIEWIVWSRMRTGNSKLPSVNIQKRKALLVIGISL